MNLRQLKSVALYCSIMFAILVLVSLFVKATGAAGSILLIIGFFAVCFLNSND